MSKLYIICLSGGREKLQFAAMALPPKGGEFGFGDER